MAALARRLAGEEIHAVYASDLQRARETATIIAAHHKLPVRADPRLREIDFGAWEGLTYDEIRQHYHQALAAWQADPMSVGPPGGEAMEDVVTRVHAALDAIARAHQDQTVLLVAHGGSLQTLLCLALDMVPRARWQFRLSSASLSELNLYEEGAILTLLNDTHHLAEVEDEG